MPAAEYVTSHRIRDMQEDERPRERVGPLLVVIHKRMTVDSGAGAD